MKLSTAIKDFLFEQQARGNSEKTLRYYSTNLDRFADFCNGDVELESINKPLLSEYCVELRGRDITDTTVQTYCRAVRCFLRWCFEEELIEKDLSAKFKLPKAKKKEILVLSESEIRRLLSSFDPRYYIQLRNFCICALMVDSGLRLSEVVTLELDRINLEESCIIVDGKGNKQRTIPLGGHTKRMLARYLRRRPKIADTKRVFLLSNMRPITDDTVSQLFKRLKERTGIERLHAHLLRHTFATTYLKNGGNIYELKLILGHTSLDMVQRYVHLISEKGSKTFSFYNPLDNFL